MKSIKSGTVKKIGAVLLIAVIMIFAVGIAANGWQADDGQSSDKPQTEQTSIDKTSENGDENDPEKNEIKKEPEPEPEVLLPEFFSSLTGLPITEEENGKKPYCFLANPAAPLYGISDAEIAIEFPIEKGSSRMMLYEADITALGKVGSLASGRRYMQNLLSTFGGTLIRYGSDDLLKYAAFDTADATLDLAAFPGVCYTENVLYLYSSGEGIQSAVKNASSGTAGRRTVLPFEFAPYGINEAKGPTAATTVTIPYSESEYTKLVYSADAGGYTFHKGAKVKTDMLTGAPAVFENVFILFADTTTYNKSCGTETVVETDGEGSGYYISEGKLTEIRWSCDDSEKIVFKTLSGEKLTVNRGKSYIGYFGSSEAYDVSFE